MVDNENIEWEDGYTDMKAKVDESDNDSDDDERGGEEKKKLKSTIQMLLGLVICQ